ncbi:type IX secretion system sortase PorU [Porifericola rhodea]|uniref:type IX secretion system sortase PorU n=1 Tax=Porifericola rhodea TaxID=930972 RepID=UPI002666CB29|nr:type IX secretion system sortase PorU [Porifericola rhodea]WKN31300.1 type IX secretion system sortase PorU [Porifericola rhodea]
MRQPCLLLYIILLCWISASTTVVAQQSSVLSSGEWYQFAISKDGVYKIDGSQLQALGINLSQIKPSSVGVFGFGGGMLAQSLSEPRFHDLPECAVYPVGLEDDSFDEEDYLLFYAQGPDKATFSQAEDGEYVLNYEKNLYADSAYYYFTPTEGNLLKIESAENDHSPTATEVSTFDNHWIHEADLYNILSPGSGREWYGEKLSSGESLNFNITDLNLATESKIKFTLDALSRSFSNAELRLSVNGTEITTLELPAIIDGTYAAKGKEASTSTTIKASELAGTQELQLNLQLAASSGSAHLNKLLITYPAQLIFKDSLLFFRSTASTKQAYTKFSIQSDVTEAQIWKLNQALRPQKVSASYADSRWSFVDASLNSLNEYVIFQPDRLPMVEWHGRVENQNLNFSQPPELLIITHELFREEAEQLAEFRRQHDHLKVAVVSTQEVYRQYASGRQDVSAIRNFAKDLYDRDSKTFKYLLLFGKSSYDYKSRIDGNTNFVPTYQSRNSIHPIYSYPSDDYYGFMEDSEGEWEESYSGDHTMDIGVGRLPIKTIEEARAVVNKLVHYASNPLTLGDWRTRVAFLADDGDNDRYQKDSELLSEKIIEGYEGYATHKIYLDAYDQETFPNQELAPQVNQAVDDAIINGVLLFNFVGHGNEQRLTDESVLTMSMISQWDNLDRLPFFVTATCEFGRHDYPQQLSGAEALVLNPEGGAIGLVTTARPVFSNTNYLLNLAFYQHIFERPNGQHQRIGDIFRQTKNDALNGRDNRNFSLLADPSMRLAYPQLNIVADSILSLDSRVQDTLKALSRLTLYGHIEAPLTNSLANDFNGELTLVLHDKPYLVSTKGNEETVMQFKETQNVIHRGRASVKNGQFVIDFIIPKNITYQAGAGSLNMYARSGNNNTDAFGGKRNIVIGGSEAHASIDQKGPDIQLFIDDISFANGNVTGSTPLLLARLWDEQGINLSRQQAGHEIKAALSREGEEDKQIILNDFYITETDEYQSGWVRYPLGYLEDGKYVLTLQAWDTHNNSNTSVVEFFVSDSDAFSIKSFYNYPNPVHTSTTFVLDHNRAGEDLQVDMQIHDSSGKKVAQLSKTFESSDSRLNLWEWLPEVQNEYSLSRGIYLVKINVRSLNDHQEAKESLKIILTN